MTTLLTRPKGASTNEFRLYATYMYIYIYIYSYLYINSLKHECWSSIYIYIYIEREVARAPALFGKTCVNVGDHGHHIASVVFTIVSKRPH